MLVTTSPGFVRNYFEPVQKFTGEIFLLENKVYPGSALPSALRREGPARDGAPWVVGCFGAFRCRRSMKMMHGLAERLREKVVFVLRGYPSGTIVADFEELLGDLPNLRFGGAYAYPEDLAGMYGSVDLNWSFDETDPAGNSAWLLPNRIYEGGCFGVPVIAAKNTETGAWIERRECGWTFAEPLEESLAAFFEGLDRAEWERVRARCAALPRADFTGEADYDALAERLREIAGGIR